jgi:putative transferase (TIGR04331 family)
MVKRFLITTALEETWRNSELVLFLGEWCKLYSRKEEWSQMEAQVLPYHWDDRTKLYSDYQFLKSFHEVLLGDLTIQLNQIHGVNHSLRYWRILIGPWLGYFIQMLYDRWYTIKQAADQYSLETIILMGEEESVIPNDMTDFIELFVTDKWNHYLYFELFKYFPEIKLIQQPDQHLKLPDKLIKPPNWKQKIKRVLIDGYTKIANIFSNDRDAFFISTYLPLADEIKVYLTFRQVPQFWRTNPIKNKVADQTRRQWVVEGISQSEFEVCARALIPKQIPKAYLEGYIEMVTQAADLPWPKNPKIIWTSNSFSSDDLFKTWAAEKVEKGAPLVIGQHGGHYGIGRWLFTEDHEIAISDIYLTWGWKVPGQKKIVPIGQLKSKKPLKIRHAEQPGAMLVTCVLPRQSYFLYSSMVSGQWLRYLNDQFAFIENLPQHIQEALTVRLSPHDLGWGQIARWNDRFPNITLDSAESKIDDLIRKSKIYISSYNATTFLESFTMNIPTVIYWDPAYWELRDTAIPYFDELKRVGIFHETPISAAQHVTNIWDDVDAWWNSIEVRETLNRFKEVYCHLPVDLLDRLESTLKEVVNNSERSA